MRSLRPLAARKTRSATTCRKRPIGLPSGGCRASESYSSVRSPIARVPAGRKNAFRNAVCDAALGQPKVRNELRTAFVSDCRVFEAPYLLMHQYIRREEDIERAGKGVYSPGLRDDAQEARNRLFSELNNLSGKDAFLAMKEIAEFAS